MIFKGIFVLAEGSPETGSLSYQVEDCTKDRTKRAKNQIMIIYGRLLKIQNYPFYGWANL